MCRLAASDWLFRAKSATQATTASLAMYFFMVFVLVFCRGFMPHTFTKRAGHEFLFEYFNLFSKEHKKSVLHRAMQDADKFTSAAISVADQSCF